MTEASEKTDVQALMVLLGREMAKAMEAMRDAYTTFGHEVAQIHVDLRKHTS